MSSRRERLVQLLCPLIVVGTIVSCAGEEDHIIVGDAPALGFHTDQGDIDEGRLELEELIERGRLLMEVHFNTLDGAGRPETTGTGDPRRRRDMPNNFNRISGPSAGSCAACHNLPRTGGGGDNAANVFVLAQRLPFVNFDGREGDNFMDHTLMSVGNERNTLGMFGAGLIELLAREMTADLRRISDAAVSRAAETGAAVVADLVSKGVSFGWIRALPDGSVDTSNVEGVDADLLIKPFHQKGVVVSLREFTVSAMNHHHGMQAAERFGDGADPDNDGVINELTVGDVTAVIVFQATLPVPGQALPSHPKARKAAERGMELFRTVKCSVCHIPALPLNDPVFTEPNPYNPPGNLRLADVSRPFAVDLTEEGPGPYLERGPDGVVMVPAFTDLKRHKMGNALNNETLVQNGVPTDEWLTRKLWGMSSEPPFLHHGRATLISEAIMAHGGEAQESRDAFAALPEEDQGAIVEFLKTLRVLPEGAESLVITAGAD